jgi:hypothetical protein
VKDNFLYYACVEKHCCDNNLYNSLDFLIFPLFLSFIRKYTTTRKTIYTGVRVTRLMVAAFRVTNKPEIVLHHGARSAILSFPALPAPK